MSEFKNHPFEFPNTVQVFYVDRIPVELLIPLIEPSLFDEKIQQLIQDISRHGIRAPLIVNVNSNGQLDVMFGSKRLVAAQALGLTHLKGIINVCGTLDDGRLIELLRGAKRLWNSDNVITMFGGARNIDLSQLFCHQDGRLVCVASDYEQWSTCVEGRDAKKFAQHVDSRREKNQR